MACSDEAKSRPLSHVELLSSGRLLEIGMLGPFYGEPYSATTAIAPKPAAPEAKPAPALAPPDRTVSAAS